MKECAFDAIDENLDAVLIFLYKELEEGDCPPQLYNDIALAAEELFINIAHYAYAPNIGTVIIRIAVSSEIIIEFEDTGIPFNPLENTDPDLTVSAVDRDMGGLGIYMVKKVMDSAEYRHEDGKNIMVIRKKIS